MCKGNDEGLERQTDITEYVTARTYSTDPWISRRSLCFGIDDSKE